MTPDQAKAYCRRWNLIRERETSELRGTSIEEKFRQLSALMASRDLLGPDPRREAEVQSVRDHWERCGARWVAEGLTGSLQAALADLLKWMATARIPAMVVGGLAASLLGRPRLTQDIDALAILPESDWNRAVDSAAEVGIIPRIPDALEFARRSRVLLMRHVASGIDLDVMLGALPFEHSAVEHSVLHDIGGLHVRLPRIEDLLVMKAVARRPKDLEDIRGLLSAHPEADVAAARRWVREFATATGMSDMLDEFDKLISAARS